MFPPQLSSIGFVGFILAVINASMNIVNNANSNNNNRNNNNNDNNDNNDNINIANLNTQQMNMQFVMAGAKYTKDQNTKKSRSWFAISSICVQATQWSRWQRGKVFFSQ